MLCVDKLQFVLFNYSPHRDAFLSPYSINSFSCSSRALHHANSASVLAGFQISSLVLGVKIVNVIVFSFVCVALGKSNTTLCSLVADYMKTTLREMGLETSSQLGQSSVALMQHHGTSRIYPLLCFLGVPFPKSPVARCPACVSWGQHRTNAQRGMLSSSITAKMQLSAH